MARFTVRLRNVTIGWSDLETHDNATATARGVFRPGLGYDLVQPVFRLFTEGQGESPALPTAEGKIARYHAARDRLGLSLHAPDGTEIPTQFIHILDLTLESRPDALEIEVRMASPEAWKRFTATTVTSPDA